MSELYSQSRLKGSFRDIFLTETEFLEVFNSMDVSFRAYQRRNKLQNTRKYATVMSNLIEDYLSELITLNENYIHNISRVQKKLMSEDPASSQIFQEFCVPVTEISELIQKIREDPYAQANLELDRLDEFISRQHATLEQLFTRTATPSKGRSLRNSRLSLSRSGIKGGEEHEAGGHTSLAGGAFASKMDNKSMKSDIHADSMLHRRGSGHQSHHHSSRRDHLEQHHHQQGADQYHHQQQNEHHQHLNRGHEGAGEDYHRHGGHGRGEAEQPGQHQHHPQPAEYDDHQHHRHHQEGDSHHRQQNYHDQQQALHQSEYLSQHEHHQGGEQVDPAHQTTPHHRQEGPRDHQGIRNSPQFGQIETPAKHHEQEFPGHNQPHHPQDGGHQHDPHAQVPHDHQIQGPQPGGHQYPPQGDHQIHPPAPARHDQYQDPYQQQQQHPQHADPHAQNQQVPQHLNQPGHYQEHPGKIHDPRDMSQPHQPPMADGRQDGHPGLHQGPPSHPSQQGLHPDPHHQQYDPHQHPDPSRRPSQPYDQGLAHPGAQTNPQPQVPDQRQQNDHYPPQQQQQQPHQQPPAQGHQYPPNSHQDPNHPQNQVPGPHGYPQGQGHQPPQDHPQTQHQGPDPHPHGPTQHHPGPMDPAQQHQHHDPNQQQVPAQQPPHEGHTNEKPMIDVNLQNPQQPQKPPQQPQQPPQGGPPPGGNHIPPGELHTFGGPEVNKRFLHKPDEHLIGGDSAFDPDGFNKHEPTSPQDSQAHQEGVFQPQGQVIDESDPIKTVKTEDQKPGHQEPQQHQPPHHDSSHRGSPEDPQNLPPDNRNREPPHQNQPGQHQDPYGQHDPRHQQQGPPQHPQGPPPNQSDPHLQQGPPGQQPHDPQQPRQQQGPPGHQPNEPHPRQQQGSRGQSKRSSQAQIPAPKNQTRINPQGGFESFKKFDPPKKAEDGTPKNPSLEQSRRPTIKYKNGLYNDVSRRDSRARPNNNGPNAYASLARSMHASRSPAIEGDPSPIRPLNKSSKVNKVLGDKDDSRLGPGETDVHSFRPRNQQGQQGVLLQDQQQDSKYKSPDQIKIFNSITEIHPPQQRNPPPRQPTHINPRGSMIPRRSHIISQERINPPLPVISSPVKLTRPELYGGDTISPSTPPLVLQGPRPNQVIHPVIVANTTTEAVIVSSRKPKNQHVMPPQLREDSRNTILQTPKSVNRRDHSASRRKRSPALLEVHTTIQPTPSQTSPAMIGNRVTINTSAKRSPLAETMQNHAQMGYPNNIPPVRNSPPAPVVKNSAPNYPQNMNFFRDSLTFKNNSNISNDVGSRFSKLDSQKRFHVATGGTFRQLEFNESKTYKRDYTERSQERELRGEPSVPAEDECREGYPPLSEFDHGVGEESSRGKQSSGYMVQEYQGFRQPDLDQAHQPVKAKINFVDPAQNGDGSQGSHPGRRDDHQMNQINSQPTFGGPLNKLRDLEDQTKNQKQRVPPPAEPHQRSRPGSRQSRNRDLGDDKHQDKKYKKRMKVLEASLEKIDLGRNEVQKSQGEGSFTSAKPSGVKPGYRAPVQNHTELAQEPVSSPPSSVVRKDSSRYQNNRADGNDLNQPQISEPQLQHQLSETGSQSQINEQDVAIIQTQDNKTHRNSSQQSNGTQKESQQQSQGSKLYETPGQNNYNQAPNFKNSHQSSLNSHQGGNNSQQNKLNQKQFSRQNSQSDGHRPTLQRVETPQVEPDTRNNIINSPRLNPGSSRIANFAPQYVNHNSSQASQQQRSRDSGGQQQHTQPAQEITSPQDRRESNISHQDGYYSPIPGAMQQPMKPPSGRQSRNTSVVNQSQQQIQNGAQYQQGSHQTQRNSQSKKGVVSPPQPSIGKERTQNHSRKGQYSRYDNQEQSRQDYQSHYSHHSASHGYQDQSMHQTAQEDRRYQQSTHRDFNQSNYENQDFDSQYKIYKRGSHQFDDQTHNNKSQLLRESKSSKNNNMQHEGQSQRDYQKKSYQDAQFHKNSDSHMGKPPRINNNTQMLQNESEYRAEQENLNVNMMSRSRASGGQNQMGGKSSHQGGQRSKYEEHGGSARNRGGGGRRRDHQNDSRGRRRSSHRKNLSVVSVKSDRSYLSKTNWTKQETINFLKNMEAKETFQTPHEKAQSIAVVNSRSGIIGYRKEGLKKYEIQEEELVKIISLKDGGNYSHVLHNSSRNYTLVYNSDKQLLYKLKHNNSNLLNVIFDEIFFSALPNRQMRLNDSESLAYIQTRERDIAVLAGIEQDHPTIVSKLRGAPGDTIIDFKPFEDRKLLCLTKNGFLSCYDTSYPEAKLLTVKRIFFSENEKPNSLEVNSKLNKISLISLKFDDKIMSKSSPKKSADGNNPESLRVMFKYNCLNIYIMEYNFVENCFESKFEKPFRIESDLNETRYPIEMNMKHTFQSDTILFMILNKSQSQTLAFLLKEDELSPISSYNLKQRTSCYVIKDNELWVLGSNGNVKVLV